MEGLNNKYMNIHMKYIGNLSPTKSTSFQLNQNQSMIEQCP